MAKSKKAQTSKEVPRTIADIMIVPSVIGIALLIWFTFTKTIFEKILICFIFVTILVPPTFSLLAMIVGEVSNPKKYNKKNNLTNKNNKNTKTNIGNNNTNNANSKKYKTKIIDNENYIRLRDMLVACSKNRILNRDDVICVKNEILDLLGDRTNDYSHFKFENDMHQIYTQIKSSKLGDKDYNYLIDFIQDLVNKNTQDIETTN